MTWQVSLRESVAEQGIGIPGQRCDHKAVLPPFAYVASGTDCAVHPGTMHPVSDPSTPSALWRRAHPHQIQLSSGPKAFSAHSG